MSFTKIGEGYTLLTVYEFFHLLIRPIRANRHRYSCANYSLLLYNDKIHTKSCFPQNPLTLADVLFGPKRELYRIGAITINREKEGFKFL